MVKEVKYCQPNDLGWCFRSGHKLKAAVFDDFHSLRHCLVYVILKKSNACPGNVIANRGCALIKIIHI